MFIWCTNMYVYVQRNKQFHVLLDFGKCCVVFGLRNQTNNFEISGLLVAHEEALFSIRFWLILD